MGSENVARAVSRSDAFARHFQRRSGVAAVYLPRERAGIATWLSGFVEAAKCAHEGKSKEDLAISVQAMADLLERDDTLREKVQSMIGEALVVHQKYEPDAYYPVDSIETMLIALNYTLTYAPPYTPEVSHSAFPVSGLFVYMMWTESGVDVFKNDDFNECLADILKAWCDYLDSEASVSVITTADDGWLGEPSYEANNLDQFVTADQQAGDPVHWGYKSYNDYFHKQVISIARPVDGIDNPAVITSANDGTVYRIARDVKEEDCFDCKEQNYSLAQMLDGSLVGDFVGGDVVQSFLNGNNYHRWWSPISGTVREARVVQGYMFSELYNEGFDPSAGTLSQGYQATVNTRGLVFIESDDPIIGMVCVIPIGITEVSSVTLHVESGDVVKKGQEIGWFSYGGSSMCLVFQKSAIKQFTVPDPLPDSNWDNGPFIRVGGQIAIANTRPRGSSVGHGGSS